MYASQLIWIVCRKLGGRVCQQHNRCPTIYPKRYIFSIHSSIRNVPPINWCLLIWPTKFPIYSKEAELLQSKVTQWIYVRLDRMSLFINFTIFTVFCNRQSSIQFSIHSMYWRLAWVWVAGTHVVMRNVNADTVCWLLEWVCGSVVWCGRLLSFATAFVSARAHKHSHKCPALSCSVATYTHTFNQ